jgi:hypothetical protein
VTREKRLGAAFVALFAFAITVSALRNGFALDDVPIIFENARVHSLTSFWHLFAQTYWPPEEGASLYRPLTMLAFAIQWVAGSGSPFAFHLFSGVLYAATCVAFYMFALELTSFRVAIVAGVLFAVHPVHVEAFANVVGQAEMWVALFCLAATTRFIHVRKKGTLARQDIALLAVLYLAACMFKEHAIVLPAIFVAAEVLLVRNSEPFKRRLREIAPLVASLAVVAVAFVVLRTFVAGGIRAGGMNELFREQGFSARLLTMLTVVVEWVRLFFWPADLSADYSFPRTKVSTEFNAAMLPGILVLIGCGFVAWRMRKSQPVVTFAFAWVLLTLAIPSNLFIVTGFVLAERTLFMASAGVVMLVAMGLVSAWEYGEEGNRFVRLAFAGAAGMIIVAGAARSWNRAPVWRDNGILFQQTVMDVPSSSRAHWMLAEYTDQKHGPRAALEEMMLAVALGRKDDPLLLGVAADKLSMAGLCKPATDLYLRALALTPANVQLRVNTSLCLIRLGRLAEARAVAEAAPASTSRDPRLARMLSLSDSLASARIPRTSAQGQTIQMN